MTQLSIPTARVISEYAGLAMAIGVLLLAVGSYLGGKDHGIGSIVVDAVKSAVQRASGGK